MSSRPPEFKNKVIILGVIIDDQPFDFFAKKFEDYLLFEVQHKIFTPNPEICLRAFENEEFRHILNEADLNLPDGFGLKLGAMILGETLENRVCGSDFTPKILERLNLREGIKVYIVLREDSLSIESDLKTLFKNNYPNIKLKAGSMSVNNLNACDDILNEINTFEPQILFVALGSPHQEIWINKFLKLVPGVKVAMTVGGSFDFLTKKIKRAPKFMRELGIEWFYRLYQEPQRLSRIKNATAKFLLTCHQWKKRIDSEYRKNVLCVIKNRSGQLLLGKSRRFNDHWHFPQGGVEKNEEMETAAIREAGEELGAPEKLFRVLKQLSSRNRYDSPPYAKLLKGYKGQEQTAFLIEYLGEDNDFQIKQSHEFEKIIWVDEKEMLEKIHPIRREFAERILNELRATQIPDRGPE
jgi:N-acetylglucosaminyldiphosphoundecaprenol N-acetyl-beta-D-mannosaminyltransferase